MVEAGQAANVQRHGGIRQPDLYRRGGYHEAGDITVHTEHVLDSTNAWDLVLIFGALLFVLQWVMTSKPNLWFLKGHAATALVAVVSVAIGNTSAWNRLVSSFVP